MRIDELERETIDVLPARHTMTLLSAEDFVVGNGINFGNGNLFSGIVNWDSGGNRNEVDQRASSNDLVTCVVGHAFDGKDSCQD